MLPARSLGNDTSMLSLARFLLALYSWKRVLFDCNSALRGDLLTSCTVVLTNRPTSLLMMGVMPADAEALRYRHIRYAKNNAFFKTDKQL